MEMIGHRRDNRASQRRPAAGHPIQRAAQTLSEGYSHPVPELLPGVPVPVSWTSGRLKHQAAFRLNFSRARAGVMYPCRWRSQPLL